MKSSETELRHTFVEMGEKICFSKELIRECSKTYPKEIISKKIPFTCISGPHAKVIKSRVIAGESVEELSTLPTEFLQTVYELLSGNHDLATLGTALHDEPQHTVAGTSDCQSTDEFVTQGLGLSDSAQAASSHLLGVQLDGALGE